jgi:hypothetical protein
VGAAPLFRQRKLIVPAEYAGSPHFAAEKAWDFG